jgi:hypothetical protein
MDPTPRNLPSKLPSKPTSRGPVGPAFIGDEPAQRPAPKVSTLEVVGWCGVQVVLGGLTLLTFTGLRDSHIISKSTSDGKENKRLTLLSLKVDDLVTEWSHKNAFRELLLTAPLAMIGSEETDQSTAEKWFRDAAQLYRSLQICEQVVRESLASYTNNTSPTNLVLPKPPPLSTDEVKEQLANQLKSASLDPAYQTVQIHPANTRYISLKGLPYEWPKLALIRIYEKLRKIDEDNQSLAEQMPRRSWFDAMR